VSRLDLELGLRRGGWLVWVALALLVGAAVLHYTATAAVHARIAEREREVGLARQSAAAAAVAAVEAAVPAKGLLEERLDAFNAVLGVRGDQGRLVGVVFEQAVKQGLTLSRAEYKLDVDRAGGFYTYQMTVPVRGPYPRVRRFIEETLAAAPGAALEEITFRRDAIGTPEPEARLRFVFFLRDAAP
jgi:hypothetical protein